MVKYVSLSLLLAGCTILPGCGACTREETKSTVATDVTDASGAVDESTKSMAGAATEEPQVDAMATKAGGNALEGGKVYDYSSLVTRGDFKSILTNNNKVVVDFFAVWCGPCKALAPQIDRLAENNKDVVFIKVDVDKFSSVSSSHGIRAMPTTIYFSNGREIERVTGADIAKVKSAVEKLKKS